MDRAARRWAVVRQPARHRSRLPGARRRVRQCRTRLGPEQHLVADVPRLQVQGLPTCSTSQDAWHFHWPHPMRLRRATPGRSEDDSASPPRQVRRSLSTLGGPGAFAQRDLTNPFAPSAPFTHEAMAAHVDTMGKGRTWAMP